MTRRVQLIIIILLVAGAAVLLGYLVYLYYRPAKLDFIPVNITQPLNNITDTTSNNQPAVSGINIDININEAVPDQDQNTTITSTEPDSDGDKLTDDLEKIKGTDINNIDTDGDDLSDYLEVSIYLTDPLNPDTDGDGYKDGVEVWGGYDPKGLGKLPEQDD
ncbi:MAG: hypothetical protein WC480_02625 [Patescibacteria group bacterium]